MAKRNDRKGDSPPPGGQHPDSSAPAIAPISVVDINSIEPNDWNPNIEDAVTFNELVDNIKKHGFSGALDVVPLGDDKYRLIGGEHRWKAAKLAGMKEVPVAINVWDEDAQKIQTVTLNLLRGKLDPAKFTKLFSELEGKYGREAVRKMMGMASKDAQFRQLFKTIKKSLPEEVQQQLESRADKVRNVEDLAAVVNSIYSRYGGTLQSSFVLFSFGGKTHLMIKMNDESFKVVKALAADCQSKGTDVNDEILRRLA